MSIERKNVMESIAKFQLHDGDESVGSTEQAHVPSDIAEPVTSPKVEARANPATIKVSAKQVGVMAIVGLILTTAIYWYVSPNKTGNLRVVQKELNQGNQDIIALKSDIAMMQTTMNTVLERLDLVASAEKLNQLKQQQVDELVVNLTQNNGAQENYFAEELAKLTAWQKQYQQQQLSYLEEQKRQLANLEVDVEKLNKDAISHNYANKFTNWQTDVETIKEQQTQINSLLLDLQKEYIKLNQYQLHQQSVVTQNMTTGK